MTLLVPVVTVDDEVKTVPVPSDATVHPAKVYPAFANAPEFPATGIEDPIV